MQKFGSGYSFYRVFYFFENSDEEALKRFSTYISLPEDIHSKGSVACFASLQSRAIRKTDFLYLGLVSQKHLLYPAIDQINEVFQDINVEILHHVEQNIVKRVKQTAWGGAGQLFYASEDEDLSFYETVGEVFLPLMKIDATAYDMSVRKMVYYMIAVILRYFSVIEGYIDFGEEIKTTPLDFVVERNNHCYSTGNFQGHTLFSGNLDFSMLYALGDKDFFKQVYDKHHYVSRQTDFLKAVQAEVRKLEKEPV